MTDLQSYFSAFCTRISSEICDIAEANTPQAKRKKYLLLLLMLSNFRNGSTTLLWSAINDRITAAQQEIQNNLPSHLSGAAQLTEAQQQNIAEQSIVDAKKRLLLVLMGMQSLASRVRGGREWSLRSLLGKATGTVTDAAARGKLAERIVQVRGRDGRDRSYHPDNYSELLQDGAEAEASHNTTLEVAKSLATDLVIVSPQPSTLNDACNIYRGRVFSISGSDPRTYPLSIVPTGGFPCHPRCHHTTSPVPNNQYTDKEIRELSSLPKEFVDLGMRGASFNEMNAMWLSKSPKEWGV